MKPDDNFNVFDENAEFALREIGTMLEQGVPEGYGFIFLMSSYGKKPGATFYTSNIQRPDVLNMMQEFIDSNGGKEELNNE